MKANFSQFKKVYVAGQEGEIFSYMGLNSVTGAVLVVRPHQLFNTEIKGTIEGSCKEVFDMLDSVDISASEFWKVYTDTAKAFLTQIK